MKHGVSEAGSASETLGFIKKKLYDVQNPKEEYSDTFLCSVKAISLANVTQQEGLLQ